MPIRKIHGITSSLVTIAQTRGGGIVTKAKVTQNNLLAKAQTNITINKAATQQSRLVSAVHADVEGLIRQYREYLYMRDRMGLLINKVFADDVAMLDLVGVADGAVFDFDLFEPEIVNILESLTRITQVYREFADTPVMISRPSLEPRIPRADDFFITDVPDVVPNKQFFEDVFASESERHIVDFRRVFEDYPEILDEFIRQSVFVRDFKNDALIDDRQTLDVGMFMFNLLVAQDVSFREVNKGLQDIATNVQSRLTLDVSKFFADEFGVPDLVGVYDGAVFDFTAFEFETLLISEVKTFDIFSDKFETVHAASRLVLSVNKFFADEFGVPDLIGVSDGAIFDFTAFEYEELFITVSRALDIAMSKFDEINTLEEIVLTKTIIRAGEGFSDSVTTPEFINKDVTMQGRLFDFAVEAADARATLDITQNKFDTLNLSEFVARYVEMQKTEFVPVLDQKSLDYALGTIFEDVNITDEIIAILLAYFEFLEEIFVTDAPVTIDIVKFLLDIAIVNEDFAKIVNFVRAGTGFEDVAVAADQRFFDVTQNKFDDVAAGDFKTLAVSLLKTDEAFISEQYAAIKAYNRTFARQVTIADTKSLQPNKGLFDEFTFTDLTLVVLIIFQNAADFFSVLDAISIGPGKGLRDLITETDLLTRIADYQRSGTGFSDIAVTNDNDVNHIELGKFDTTPILDVKKFDVVKSRTDEFNALDSIFKFVDKPASDEFVIQDVKSLRLDPTQFDFFSLDDSSSTLKIKQRPVFDTLLITDKKQFDIVKSLQDSFSLLDLTDIFDGLNYRFSLIKLETAVVEDHVFKDIVLNKSTDAVYPGVSRYFYNENRFPYSEDFVTNSAWVRTATEISVPNSEANLLLYSEQLFTSPWQFTTSGGTSISITSNTTRSTDPLGTNTAEDITVSSVTATVFTSVQTVASLTSGQTYLFSVYLKASSNRAITLTTRSGSTAGAVVAAASKTVTTSWVRHAIAFSSNTSTLALIINGSVSSGSVFIWGAQLNPGTITSNYVRTTSAAINGTAAPDGTFTATRLTEFAASSNHNTYFTGLGPITNRFQTFSIYAKAAERSKVWLELSNFTSASTQARFNLANGTIEFSPPTNADFSNTAASIESVGSGWYRLSVTARKASVNSSSVPVIWLDNGINNLAPYTGATNSGIYIWGAQIGVASEIQPYLKTTGSIITATKLRNNSSEAIVFDINKYPVELLNVADVYRSRTSAQRLLLESLLITDVNRFAINSRKIETVRVSRTDPENYTVPDGNLLRWSENHVTTSNGWTVTTAPGTLTQNTGVAPDGSATAELFTNSTTSSWSIQQTVTSLAVGAQYAYSVYLGWNSSTAVQSRPLIRITQGASSANTALVNYQTWLGTSGTVSAWTRYSVDFVANTSVVTISISNVGVTSTATRIWGSQLNIGRSGLIFDTTNAPTNSSNNAKVFNTAYGVFLNAYGIWDAVNTSASTLTREYSINFPDTKSYTFSISADNSGYILLDGVAVVTSNNLAAQTTSLVAVTKGLHTITVVGLNFNGAPASPADPAAVAATITNYEVLDAYIRTTSAPILTGSSSIYLPGLTERAVSKEFELVSYEFNKRPRIDSVILSDRQIFEYFAKRYPVDEFTPSDSIYVVPGKVIYPADSVVMLDDFDYTDKLEYDLFISKSDAAVFDDVKELFVAKQISTPNQYTNLLIRSEELQTANVWITSNATIVANVSSAATLSPIGTATVEKLLENTTNAQHFVYHGARGAATSGRPTETFSIYLKSAERRYGWLQLSNLSNSNIVAFFDLSSGTIAVNASATGAEYINGRANIQSVGSGWYRCSITATKRFTVNNSSVPVIGVASSLTTTIYVGVATSGIYAWGAQLVSGPTIWDYLATTGATRTAFLDGTQTVTMLDAERYLFGRPRTEQISLTDRNVERIVLGKRESIPVSDRITRDITLRVRTTSTNTVVTLDRFVRSTQTFRITRDTQNFADADRLLIGKQFRYDTVVPADQDITRRVVLIKRETSVITDDKRYDYFKPIPNSGQIRHTNLLKFSEQLEQASVWQTANATIVANVSSVATLAPDGTATAEKLNDTTATGQHEVRFIGLGTVSANVSQTASVYAKAAQKQRFLLQISSFVSAWAGAIFDVSSGTIISTTSSGEYSLVSANLVSVGNGWYRASVSVNRGATANVTSAPIITLVTGATTTFSYTGVAGSGLYVWGAALSRDRRLNSYVQTTSAARTVAGDTIDQSVTINDAQIISASRFRVPTDSFLLNDAESNRPGKILQETIDTVDQLTNRGIGKGIRRTITPIDFIVSELIAGRNLVSPALTLTDVNRKRITKTPIENILLPDNVAKETTQRETDQLQLSERNFNEFGKPVPNQTILFNTNQLRFSEQLENAAWITSNATIAANVSSAATLAPDGTASAEKLNENGGNGLHFVGYAALGTSSNNINQTFSIYAKAAQRSRVTLRISNTVTFEADSTFDLSSGTIISNIGRGEYSRVSSTITSVGSGWYRISMSAYKGTTTSLSSAPYVLLVSGASTLSYTGTPGSGVYLWGASLSQDRRVHPYIQTTSAARTVAGDTFEQQVSVSDTDTQVFAARRSPEETPVILDVKRFTMADRLRDTQIIEDQPYKDIAISVNLVPGTKLENQLRYSEELQTANIWSTSNTTVNFNVSSAATLAPDGTVTVDKLNENGANSTHLLFYTALGAVGSSVNQTFSIYAKAAERRIIAIQLLNQVAFSATVYADVSSGTILSTAANGEYTSITSTITAAGSGWYRISVSARKGATTSLSSVPAVYLVSGTAASYTPTYAGTTGSGAYLWGAQLNSQLVPFNYTRTTATALTFRQPRLRDNDVFITDARAQKEVTKDRTETLISTDRITRKAITTLQGETQQLLDIFNKSATTKRATVESVGVGSRETQPVQINRQNFLLYSEQFEIAGSWTTSNATVSSNVVATTAPDGTNTADRIIETTATGNHGLQTGNIMTSGVTYNVSIYAKADSPGRYLQISGMGIASVLQTPVFVLSGSGTVYTSSGTSVLKSATIASVGNGWYRCSIVAVPTSLSAALFYLSNTTSTTTNASYAGSSTVGMYLWGAQATTGSALLTYTRTTSAGIYQVINFPETKSLEEIRSLDTNKARTESVTQTDSDRYAMVLGRPADINIVSSQGTTVYVSGTYYALEDYFAEDYCAGTRSIQTF